MSSAERAILNAAGDFYFLNRLYSHNYWSDKDDPYHKIWINAGGRLLDGVVNACGFTDGAVVVPDSDTLHYFEELRETLSDVNPENAAERIRISAPRSAPPSASRTSSTRG